MTIFAYALFLLVTVSMTAALLKLGHMELKAERAIELTRRIQGERPLPAMARAYAPARRS